jgi:hypothetical protein
MSKAGRRQGKKKSPIHANILLYKLDCYIKNILIPKYTVRDMHPVY